MRALILSDIHANFEALDAVLAAAADWDVLWNLGDMVGYGASPNEVLEVVRPISTLVVRGNHDRACSGLTSTARFNPIARAAAAWTVAALTSENLDWLRNVPQGPLEPPADAVTGPKVSLAHGSPLNEDQYIFNMRDAWAPLHQMSADITFVGHTHVQGGFWQNQHEWHEIRPRYSEVEGPETWTLALPPGTRHLINPGSVGQPRDCDWRAAAAIFDTERCEITYYRVPYDLAGAQRRVRLAGLPESLAARLAEGR
jgi:predicted phosphodiesterase